MKYRLFFAETSEYMLKPGKQARLCEKSTISVEGKREQGEDSVQYKKLDYNALVHTQIYYPNEGQQIWKRQGGLKNRCVGRYLP